jgi:acyl transferase domain-containing protein
LNNDGSDKASFTAPSVRGQAEVIAMAQADAGVSPRRSPTWKHTAPPRRSGDPIEVEALTLAFRHRSRSMAREALRVIGSIKSNIGHLTPQPLEPGVIKTALALRRGGDPFERGLREPEPGDRLRQFALPRGEREHRLAACGLPRIAGVSSFGVGGTNAHVILAEPPVGRPRALRVANNSFLLSAKSKTSLDAMTDNLRNWLEATPERVLGRCGLHLASRASTLQASPP